MRSETVRNLNGLRTLTNPKRRQYRFTANLSAPAAARHTGRGCEFQSNPKFKHRFNLARLKCNQDFQLSDRLVSANLKWTVFCGQCQCFEPDPKSPSSSGRRHQTSKIPSDGFDRFRGLQRRRFEEMPDGAFGRSPKVCSACSLGFTFRKERWLLR